MIMLVNLFVAKVILVHVLVYALQAGLNEDVKEKFEDTFCLINI